MAKKKDNPVEEPKTDTRYPYTYACDLVRMIAGHEGMSTKLSRSDASQIRELFATVTGIDDETLAGMLADYYKANQHQIESDTLHKILPFLNEER